MNLSRSIPIVLLLILPIIASSQTPSVAEGLPQLRHTISGALRDAYFRNFKDNEIEASVEAYYKTMHNQVLFGEGTQLLEQTNFDDVLVFGQGKSYGIEFFAGTPIGDSEPQRNFADKACQIGYFAPKKLYTDLTALCKRPTLSLCYLRRKCKTA